MPARALRSRPLKNLGLLLGYEARFKPALHAYATCRQLCRESKSPYFLGIEHGNAWLRAAMIHGKLLREDGDLHKAWRLFLEYRRYFGDDYNFSIAFGEFANHMKAYDMAYAYLLHAKNLQPFCPKTYVLILDVAKRTSGTRDEVIARVEVADKEYRAARERFKARTENFRLKRICGGLLDVSEGGAFPGEKVMRLNPDPLAGADPNELPEWLAVHAAKRSAFVPYDPAEDPDALPEPDPAEDDGEPAVAGDGDEERPRAFDERIAVVGILVAAAVALMLVWRRGKAA